MRKLLVLAAALAPFAGCVAPKVDVDVSGYGRRGPKTGGDEKVEDYEEVALAGWVQDFMVAWRTGDVEGAVRMTARGERRAADQVAATVRTSGGREHTYFRLDKIKRRGPSLYEVEVDMIELEPRANDIYEREARMMVRGTRRGWEITTFSAGPPKRRNYDD
jgi:hypothetical protein